MVVAVVVVVGLSAVGATLALRRPLQRRWFSGSAFEEWRATARRFPWRDRLCLERANSRGRAASPALAALAVQRGQVMAEMLDRMQTVPSMRWLHRALVVLGSLSVVFNAGLVLTGEATWSAWFNLVAWGVLTLTYAVMPRLQRRRLRRVQRSVQLNEAQLSG